MRSLAVLGTGSDVGKSIITTALCRILVDEGRSLAPFKAQNMSNNAGVTPDGGEMGRAQIVQAEAARLAPHVDMNPVLIKPNTDKQAQVIVLGEVLGNSDAWSYFKDTSRLRAVAEAALDRLITKHGAVVIEGAGSCAEVNLRARDFVNFDMAHAADANVLLVADIHKGGVFAQVVGTLDCLDDRDRSRVAGVLINRFRGDIRLFEDGVRWIEQRTGVPVLGVIPWLPQMNVESEDALPLEPPRRGGVRVGVIRLPHIANFTDFLAVSQHAELHWLNQPQSLAGFDLVILPGTKNTRYDLDWLRQVGWDRELAAYSGALVGVCGGYQMLGRSIADPRGVEGPPGTTPGLGYLDVDTEMAGDKHLTRVRGELFGAPAVGYEIHMGRTAPGAEPVFQRADGTWDGARVGRVWGCYVHGLFDEPAALYRVLHALRPDLDLSSLRDAPGREAAREAAYDRLAAHVRANLDLDRLAALL